MSKNNQISPQARRWLDTISFAEGTWGNQRPIYDRTYAYKKIDDLSRHPDRSVTSGNYTSTAAGAYQFLTPTWTGVQNKLGLPDFGPESQDLAALELIRRRGVDPDKDPINPSTVALLSPEWASFPTLEGKSFWGQPVKSFKTLYDFSQSRGENPSASASVQTETNTTPEQQNTETNTTPEQQNAVQSLYRTLEAFTNLIRGGGDDGDYDLDIPRAKEFSEVQMVNDQEKDTQALLKDMILDRSKAIRKEEEMREQTQADLGKYAADSKKAAANMLTLAMDAFATPKTII
jgi:muramidase (phage lysozyme)